MPAPGLFKDISKRVSDLLTKEYPGDKKENRVEWKSETSNGVTFESNFVQDKNGATVATITPKYKYPAYGAEFTGELNTKKEFKGEVAITDKLVSGLKTTVSGNSKGNDIFAAVGIEYKHERGTFTSTIDLGKAKGSTLQTSAVVGAQGFAFGVSSDYFLGGSQLQTLNATASYKSDEFDVTAFGRAKNEADVEKNEVGGTYFHKINDALAVGTEVVFDISNSETKPKITFGTQYTLNRDTVLKGKLDTTGLVGFSYGQRLNKNSKITASTSVDSNNLSGKNASFGFTVSLND